MNLDYDKLLKFAKENIKLINRPLKHKFRDRYTHTLRVLKWGERIQAIEGGDYRKAYGRIIKYTNGIDERKILLRTKAGRKFYEDKIKFIKSYIKELEQELE